MNIEDCPIVEFYDDEMSNLFMFFSNGKKEFWKFAKVKELGINSCVLFFPRDFKKLANIYPKCKKIYEFKSASSISPVYIYDNKVLIALCPLGGAASINLMEELMFVGVKNFIGVGSSGAIRKVDLEQYFVPEKAIRDEGSSYHYLKPSRYVETDDTLRNNIISVLKENNEKYETGVVWTTDAIYRETPGRIRARIKDGAKAVEMETASLAAVAKAKNIRYAGLLYYSDYNDGKTWETRIYDKYQLRDELVRYAVEALLKNNK